MNKFEVEILKSIRSISTPTLDTLMQIITFLGEEYVVILILAIIYLLIDKKLGQRITYTMFSSILINGFIKGFVQRVRPFHFDDSYEAVRIETATGYSFPSGHTQNTTTIFTAVATTIKKRWAIIGALIISLLVAYSRIHLGVHYPTDVICGLALGLLIAFFGTKLHQKFEGDFKKQLKLYIVTLLVFTPCLLIFCLFANKNNDGNFYEAIYPYRNYYISYALFAGFTLGSFLENKFVNFDCNVSVKVKVLRMVFGAIVVAAVMFGLKALLPKHILCDMFRYFMITFGALGLYPLLAKKWLFPTSNKKDA